MSNKPLQLTRNQLAEFLPNPRAVRAFEQLLKQVGDLLPSDVTAVNQAIQEVYTEAATGSARADQALDLLSKITQALHLLALAPAPVKQDEQLIIPTAQPGQLTGLPDVTTNSLAAGNLLIYDATTKQWRNALLTQGSNVTITNADGSITIAVSGAPPTGAAGGVLSGTYPNPGFAVDMATQAELDAAIATREPTISAGTTSQFWRGDKSWQDFFTSVRAATLTGLSTATNAVITATDTVLSALGKLQKQVSDNLTTLTTHTGNTSNPHSTTAAQVGLGNVDNTSDATKNAAAVSLTNKTGVQVKVDSGNGGNFVLRNHSASGTTHKYGALLWDGYRDVSDPSYVAGIWAEGIDPVYNQADIVFGVQYDAGASYPAGRIRINGQTGHLLPEADNTQNLGSASKRYATVYAGTGTINTSDADTKQQIAELTEAERRVARRLKGLIRTFKFNESVAEKGDKARTHVGAIAQDVKAAFEAEGLDPRKYAVLCFDQWEDEYREVTEAVEVEDEETGEKRVEFVGTGEQVLVQAAGSRYGLRYDQLFAFIIAAL